MRKLLLVLLVNPITLAGFAQSTGIVQGRVIAEQTKEPLQGATVLVRGAVTAGSTGKDGRFQLQEVQPGKVDLVISYVGYETREVTVNVFAGAITQLEITLALVHQLGDELVVTASRRPEKMTNAPASIQVIGLKELELFPGSNVGELVARVQGMEYTRTGLTEIGFNARGLNSAFNNKVFQLVDGRNSMSALSASLPVMNRGTTIKDDIEKIEIVLGPQTALYGPNAHNALFNTITRDPRKYPGTSVSLSAGSRYQFSGRIRHAVAINNRWAYKLSGEYATGKEYAFYDSVYAGNQTGTTPFFGPPVAIPERNVDLNFRHVRGEGHVYYTASSKADLVLSAGSSHNNWPQVTTAGRNQMRGVTYSFLQARLNLPHVFVNVYNTWGSLGTSYAIGSYTRDFWNRTHSTLSSGPNRRLDPDSAELFAMRTMFKEKDQRVNAELQYHRAFKPGWFLVAGLNFQQENPHGFGVTLVDSFQRIHVKQAGGVLQLEKTLAHGWRLVSAARYDHHDNFGNFFAPKFAITKVVGDGSFRLTWGRAYAMPSIQNQYAGIGRFLFGNGGAGIKYIPTNAMFSDPASIATTTPLKPEQVSTWELGYKGTISKRLFVDINYYDGRSRNFISPTITVAGRALSVNNITVTHSQPFAGTVIRDTLRNASFSTFFNYGAVRAYGLDLGINYSLNKFLELAGRYSWFGSDITRDDLKNDANKDGYVSPEEKSLNAPRHRAVLGLKLRELLDKRLSIDLYARYVEQYDFYSASQIGTKEGAGERGKIDRPGQSPIMKNFDWGPLGGFTTFDFNAGFKLDNMTTVTLGVTNCFNTKQVEFVGSPSIGRLLMLEVRVQLPAKQ